MSGPSAPPDVCAAFPPGTLRHIHLPTLRGSFREPGTGHQVATSCGPALSVRRGVGEQAGVQSAERGPVAQGPLPSPLGPWRPAQPAHPSELAASPANSPGTSKRAKPHRCGSEEPEEGAPLPAPVAPAAGRGTRRRSGGSWAWSDGPDPWGVVLCTHRRGDGVGASAGDGELREDLEDREKDQGRRVGG